MSASRAIAHANRMAEEFLRRSTRYGRCEMREIVPARFDPWAKHPSATKVLLDPAGQAMDSVRFSQAGVAGRAWKRAIWSS